MKLLIKKGADINALSGSRENILQIASKNDNENIIKLLIEKRADVNALSKSRESAL